MRRNYSASRLVRLLGDEHPQSGTGAGPDIAQRLGQWVSAFDAVTLHAAHQAIAAPAAGGVLADAAGALEQLQAYYQRVRTALSEGISADLPAAPEPLADLDAPQAPSCAPASFVPFRKHCLDQQRQMALKIGPLRADARRTLSRASPRLRQLAMLDALWEQMLAAREHKLLATVPLLLERRFEALRMQQADAPAPAQSTSWLDGFARHAREVLLAELELRLQPVAGLIHAFSSEVKK